METATRESLHKEMIDPAGPNTAAEEHKNHRYIGTRIPWFVHLLWVSYWAFAIWYVITFQLDTMKTDFLKKPTTGEVGSPDQ